MARNAIRRTSFKMQKLRLVLRKRFSVPEIAMPANRRSVYKAICLLEQKDLTGWVDEQEADAAAISHRKQMRHPVDVLESR